MKRCFRWLFPALFLLAAIAMIWFLHLFVRVDRSMSLIDWDTSVRILPDGTEEPVSFDSYSNTTDLSGTYRFTGTLPQGFGSGDLLFETTGVSLSLTLDGKDIWQSRAGVPDGTDQMSQARIPLPKGASGELSLTCEILDGSMAIFPPLVRFLPDGLETMETTAFANRGAFPSGAAALALLLVFGVFLLGIARKHTDWSLIPLMLAMFGLILFQLAQLEGSYFLPPALAALFSRQEIGVCVFVLLLLYLVMNRKHRFWRYLGIAAAWSAAALLIAYVVSLHLDGRWAAYLSELPRELQAGLYSGLFYWLTLWLSFVCAVISAYSILRTYIIQQTQTRQLLLKNHMVTENYRQLKERITEKAEKRHEIRHQLTALNCLFQKQDYPAAEALLLNLLQDHSIQSPLTFTPNLTVNTILQDAAKRAKQKGIRFHTSVRIPEELPIPETDLCTLLMNLLDNALEGAQKAAPSRDPYVSIHIKLVDCYLAVKCENRFDGKLKSGKNGEFLTTKEDPLSHGFGCRQMEEIAEKYQSVMLYQVPRDCVFLAETALLLPESEK